MQNAHDPTLLHGPPRVEPRVLQQVRDDYEAFASHAWPEPLETLLAEHYGLDVNASYAGFPLSNPWGKASGQLSMTARQVEEDVAAGLGFVVLKTVIAQDATGQQTMRAWAVREARMAAEPITSRRGETGWTISWKGRGWWGTFEEYLQLIRDAQQLARNHGTLIVPSCKYHLPAPGEEGWNTGEYAYTTTKLLDAWRETPGPAAGPMPLEKDFSPTLAGSDRATAQTGILQWLRVVHKLMREGAAGSTGDQTRLRVGLKLFNALFDDEFQLEMLRTIHAAGDARPDFFIYGNRLFDPEREFDGHRGIAYGGPDLSDRNLRVMSRFAQELSETKASMPPLEWSATGNITTGRMALEYALRGATSFQLHTFFQLPSDQYRAVHGSKVQKALHELYFHPEHGFIVWLHHLATVLDLPRAPIRFLDVVGQGTVL